MKTFKETLEEVRRLKGRRIVLRHLADLLESEFLAASDEALPKHLLLSEDKVPVSADVFDSVVADLLSEIKDIEDKVHDIDQLTLTPPKG